MRALLRPASWRHAGHGPASILPSHLATALRKVHLEGEVSRNSL
jgi:hypothetical protein